jgi:hypothetical protein
MEKPEYSVTRFIGSTRRCANSEGANVHFDLSFDDIGNNIPGNDDTRIRAWLARSILDMVPDERSSADDRVDIEKKLRLVLVDSEMFQVGVGPVFLDMVYPYKPSFFRVGNCELTAHLLQRRMA